MVVASQLQTRASPWVESLSCQQYIAWPDADATLAFEAGLSAEAQAARASAVARASVLVTGFSCARWASGVAPFGDRKKNPGAPRCCVERLRRFPTNGYGKLRRFA